MFGVICDKNLEEFFENEKVNEAKALGNAQLNHKKEFAYTAADLK